MQRLITALIVSAFVLNSAPLVAQPVQESQPSTFMDDDQRRDIYERGRLSELEAVGWTLLLPGAGNIYAEQYFVGGAIMTAFGFALTFLGYGLATDQDKFLIYAAIGGGVAYSTGIVTSILAVDSYNENLRRALKVSDLGADSQNPAVLTWSWRF